MMCHGATWDTGMTLQQLQDFVAVVEQGSLRRAGQAKGKSEASLSKSIKRLEVALGTELLRRGVRGAAGGEWVRGGDAHAVVRVLGGACGGCWPDDRHCGAG